MLEGARRGRIYFWESRERGGFIFGMQVRKNKSAPFFFFIVSPFLLDNHALGRPRFVNNIPLLSECNGGT